LFANRSVDFSYFCDVPGEGGPTSDSGRYALGDPVRKLDLR
jgi:hypothetical protein